jgi:3-hydroxyisobutyrate dehydrogenase
MGLPMAGHLLAAGKDLAVWNRTAAKAEPLRAKGASVAESLQALGAECEAVMLCVARSEDVEQCLEGLTQSARPGTLFVDHSTILPKAAEGFHESLSRRGFRFVDAPITGGSMGAEKGQLTIFCGGEKTDVENAIEHSRPYARRAERVGGPGSGQLMKMVNQVAVAGALLAMCESLALAEKAGLDLVQTRELVGSGAAGSWAFENYAPKVLQRDWSPGFTVENQLKDLDYCLETAREVGGEIPGAKLVTDLLERLRAEGHGDKTTAILYEYLRTAERSPARG